MSYATKTIEHLGLVAGMFDELGVGELIDELYLIAARAMRRLELMSKVGHQDITSFHVDGAYNSDDPPVPEEGVVHITRGYSRDGKPELNQVALELIHEHQASLPVAMQVLDGNQNDKKPMSAVKTHITQLRQVGISVLVKDSAGYSDKALKAHEEASLKWIMRVPAILAEAKALLETTDPKNLRPLTEGYHYLSVTSTYAGVPQRWLIIHSQAAQARASRSVSKQVLTLTETECKAFEKLCRKAFACEQDATAATARDCSSPLRVYRILRDFSNTL